MGALGRVGRLGLGEGCGVGGVDGFLALVDLVVIRMVAVPEGVLVGILPKIEQMVYVILTSNLL